MHRYTRERVGCRRFAILTPSKEIHFAVSVAAEKHGYANGERTEWSATVTLRFNGNTLNKMRTTAAQPPGVDLDTATNDHLWSALNLTQVTNDLIKLTDDFARGPVAQVLEFSRGALDKSTCDDLDRYRDFAQVALHTVWKWSSTPDQVLMAAGDVQVDDVVVERNYQGNVERYAYVHSIETAVAYGGVEKVQFVYAPDAEHPTSGWYSADSLLEVVRVR